MIDEYRNENKRVRKTETPKYFKESYTINNEKKDPVKVFKEAAFHYMSDETREKKKLEYSKSIEQKTNVVETVFSKESLPLTKDDNEKLNQKEQQSLDEVISRIFKKI